MKKFTIRAPIDGIIRTIADVGADVSGGISKAEIEFDNLRVGMSLEPKNPPILDAEQDTSDRLLVEVFSDLMNIQLEQESRKVQIALDNLRIVQEESELFKSLSENEKAYQEGDSEQRDHGS